MESFPMRGDAHQGIKAVSDWATTQLALSDQICHYNVIIQKPCTYDPRYKEIKEK